MVKNSIFQLEMRGGSSLQGGFRGKPAFLESLKDLTEYHVNLADRYPEFVCSLVDRKVFHDYLYIMLLKTPYGLQRVHIEHLACDFCHWYGATANPMIPDLYFGVADKWEVMRRAERHPVLPCPRCGSKLPRHPIWTEPLP